MRLIALALAITGMLGFALAGVMVSEVDPSQYTGDARTALQLVFNAVAGGAICCTILAMVALRDAYTPDAIRKRERARKNREATRRMAARGITLGWN